jgi:uncharacterized protein YcaQ
MAASATISRDEARRLAVAAQGLNDRRPSGRVDRRHLRAMFERVGVVQIDSVNVLARAHELAVFARLGPYPRDLIARASAARDLFEYWGHEASFLPVESHRLFRWKMAMAEHLAWKSVAQMNRERPGYVESIYAAVVDRGPLLASELSERTLPKGAWWDWDHAKTALEWLFYCGRVTARRRVNDFARLYDLPERMLPASALAAPTPTEADARKELLLLAARSLGVATAGDLADYYRQLIPKTRPLVAELVEEGRLVAVLVEGWKPEAYVLAGTKAPRRVQARALLSPFDSLVWERARLERLFGFHYRVEIYTPAPKRRFGYYVMPFLLGDELVARVDLKADRGASDLLVRGSFAEPGVPPEVVAEDLAAELELMAGWLGLERVMVADRGDLAPALRKVVGH